MVAVEAAVRAVSNTALASSCDITSALSARLKADEHHHRETGATETEAHGETPPFLSNRTILLGLGLADSGAGVSVGCRFYDFNVEGVRELVSHCSLLRELEKG